jgi:osmoprotectant transport system substrate-binding protein
MEGLLKNAVSLVVLLFAAACVFQASDAGRAEACVGRTIYVGYFNAPEQVMVANILAVFIDERTGTTVKLTRFDGRDAAFEAVRQDKISLYADYSSIVLGKFAGERPTPDEEMNFARLKEVLNRKYNVVWLESLGYDRYFPDKGKAVEKPGQAGMMLCKEALSKFPALPKLLAKLKGMLDNATMESLLREAESSEPKAVARRFLKSRKLI